MRYAIQDLADLAEVSRRTVRYYVQEGLIPAALGRGARTSLRSGTSRSVAGRSRNCRRPGGRSMRFAPPCRAPTVRSGSPEADLPERSGVAPHPPGPWRRTSRRASRHSTRTISSSRTGGLVPPPLHPLPRASKPHAHTADFTAWRWSLRLRRSGSQQEFRVDSSHLDFRAAAGAARGCQPLNRRRAHP